MENNENIAITKHTAVNQLKCSNCGSSHFRQGDDDVYICNYCNSTIKLKNDIKDKFVSFFKPTTKETKNIYAVKPIVSKDQFWKNATIYMGMTPTAPDDLLDAKFSKIEQHYGYYISFDVEFTIITISTEVKRFAGSTALEHNGEELSKNYNCCVRLNQANIPYEEAMLRAVLPAGEIYSNKISKDMINSMDKNFPTKESIKQSIENEIAGLKNKIRQEVASKNINIVHNITNSAIYVIPEYTLKYNYQGNDYRLDCLSCESKIYGDLPKGKGSNLDKDLNKKAKTIFAVPSILALVSILLSILQVNFFRHAGSQTITIISVLVVIISFLIANAVQKPIVVKLKTKHFLKRKQKVEDFVKNSKMPELSGNDESSIGQYIRWY